MAHWSGPVMDSPAKFSRHWARLAGSFLSWDKPNGLLLRYEDLHSMDLCVLAEHCRLSSINSDVLLSVRTGLRRESPSPLSNVEIQEIRSVVGSLAEQLGYQGPSEQRAVA